MQGSGSQCGELHACCLPDHGCQMLSSLCCDGQGGTSFVGETCAATEACCFFGGSCEDLNSACCGFVGGEPVGPTSICLGDINADGFDDACDGDCNANGIPDECDIACGPVGEACDLPGCGGSGDCNANGFPDECEVAGNDCNNNDLPDDCDLVLPPVDLVFIMDTSQSMEDEARALCCELEGAINELAVAGFEVMPTLLGITVTPGGLFSCLETSVRNLFGSDLPGDPPDCCQTLGGNEDWGPATAIVAAEFPWTVGAVRVIVPISDEGPRDGDPCFDPGEDRDAIEYAIPICNENSVTVSPITGNTSRTCVITMATRLASGTGGSTFQSTDANADLPGAIIDIVRAAASQDCNSSGVPDECELLGDDCNNNSIPDGCERDCQGNGIPDDCDIISGGSTDMDGNAVPDECQDCNGNGIFDPDDIDAETSLDCNSNTIPDECDFDCNGNGIPDRCDVDSGFSVDCTLACGNGIPDECESDCNANGRADSCDITIGDSSDCRLNGVPNECEIRIEDGGFCNGAQCAPDCQGNALPDECDLADGTSEDCNLTGVPDECELVGNDCNNNGAPDECDLEDGTSQDCNGTVIPDECELAGNDCNNNGIPDECDLADGTSNDCNNNGISDACELVGNDCNNNAIPDDCELVGNDCNHNGIPDQCEVSGNDCNDNGVPDLCEPAVKPGYDLFVTGAAKHDFAETPLPAGFFGPGSEPFDALVDLEGLGIESFLGFDVGATDTIVRRREPAYLGGSPASDTIEIELVALSLRSIAPIVVTFAGAAPNKDFDVVVTLSRSQASRGSMVINRTSCAGGDYEASLTVIPFFTFTEVDSSPPVVFTLDGATLDYEANVVTIDRPSWERVPTHDQTTVLGLTGDATNLAGAPWFFDFYIFGSAVHVGPHPEVSPWIDGGTGPPPPPPTGGSCLLAGTQITMSDGSYKSIEDVEVGDRVQSLDVRSGKDVVGVVAKTLHHRPDEMPDHYLIIDGSLRVTPNHHLSRNGRWVRADAVKVGDFLGGARAPVSKVEKVFRRVPTYDLMVRPLVAPIRIVDGKKAGAGRATHGRSGLGQRREQSMPFYAQLVVVLKPTTAVP